jgi:hypothetical protein
LLAEYAIVLHDLIAGSAEPELRLVNHKVEVPHLLVLIKNQGLWYDAASI